MRAIALLEPERVAVVDVPEPECGPDEARVQMRAVGLCGSDRMVYVGTHKVPDHPWVLGHEGGGDVVAVGQNVTKVVVGQRVVLEPNICCFHCTACLTGRTSACLNRRALGISIPGIGAERICLPAEFCWPVPDNTPDATLAGFEPHVVAFAAAQRAGVVSGERCLVVGAGSQGLMMCHHLLSVGCEPYVIEPHEGRRALAVQLGAHLHDEQRRSQTDGYPIVFETSGAQAAFRAALDCTAVGGQLVLIGQTNAGIPISSRELVQRQITIRGSLIYDHPTDFAHAVEALVKDHTARPDVVMQARYAPADANRAFAEAPTVSGKSWIDLTRW